MKPHSPRLVAVVWAVLSLVFACGNGTRTGGEREESPPPALGRVHLPLVTAQQDRFRLRDAVFDIARPGDASMVTLDSERDPDAVALDAELPQGVFEITLHDGWQLEQASDSEPVSAALLTANPLEFEIQNARVTELNYRFATERGVVALGAGSVSVSIAVTQPTGPSCDLLDRASCPSGQGCRLADDSGRTFCAAAGALPAGSPCNSESCEAGAQCLKLDNPNAEQGVCARFCDPALPRAGCACQGLTLSPAVGVCLPVPPATTGASVIEFEPEAVSLQPISLGDDQLSSPLPIGFDFEFFGRSFSTLQVSSNGFIQLGSTGNNDGCCSGRELPSPDGIDNIVAFAWTDWFPPGGRVSVETRGVAPRRRFLLDFVIVPEFGGSGSITTQVKLFEGSNFIEVHTASQVVVNHIVTQGVENADGTRAFFLPGRVATQFQLSEDAVRFRTDVGLPPVVCGDGRREGNEQCDDGNALPGDGCDFNCVVEPGCAVTIERELMITDTSVVDDALRTGPSDPSDPRAGSWSFGRLMRAAAALDFDAPARVEDLFRTWQTDQFVNGFTVPARPQIGPLLLDAWPRINGQLDLDRSPLTLNAIVNRIDLRDLTDGHAGEGRFVFAVNSPGSTFPQQFTVILEYRLPASSGDDVTAWAAAWHQLGSFPFPSEQYNAALQRLTDRFTRRGAEPSRVNGSALRHVRSNEIALQSPWELREFVLRGDGALAPSPVGLTPDDSFNFSPTLSAFINQNAAQILRERHTVPLLFQGLPFQGGSSFNNLGFWQSAGILDNEARHAFSLNTCNGCHGGETGVSFLQVSPRIPGSPAGLSGFLTGTTVTDPVTGQPRRFNDLARRQADLVSLLCSSAAPSAAAAPAPSDLALGSGRVH